MGVALYPAFERDVPGYDPSIRISGKALAKAVDGGRGPLEDVCLALGVTPIFQFYYETSTEGFAKIGEPVPPTLTIDDVQWFEAAEGLRTVDALLAYSATTTMEPRLLDDLKDLLEILSVALAHRTRFRLRIDI